MPLVRLASRAVIGAFEQPSDVARALPELDKSGIKPVNVSLLAPARTFDAAKSTDRAKGLLAPIGKGANWLGEARRIDRAGEGALLGTGVLGEVLAESPNTSPGGALVMQGVPQRDALTYVDLLAAGKILALIDVADRTMGERVRGILVKSGATAVAYFSGRPYGTAYHGTGPGLR
jgi:hypothetical protein